MSFVRPIAGRTGIPGQNHVFPPTVGGDSPLWMPDGSELFYRNGDAVMAVAATSEPGLSLMETPKILFRETHVGTSPANASPWNISRDGKRFLMLEPPATPAFTAEGPRRINIFLVNWFEELKQRVPVQ